MIRRDTPRELAAIGSATILEVVPGACWIPGIQTLSAGGRVAGRAYCARLRIGDNLGAHLAVATAPSGSVIVIDGAMDTSTAYWGDLLTYAAMRRGIAGVVLSASVRDVAQIRAAGLPLFAAGISPVGPRSKKSGAVRKEVRIGHVAVRTGDWIVADDDGVVVFPADSEVQALEAASKRIQREADLRDRIEAGQTTLEALGLDRRPAD